MIGKPSPQAEAKFISYTLKMVCEKGGTRMQMTMADMAKVMQKEDALHEVNLFRKAFGNITECMKYPKHKFYIIDSMVIKMKKHEDIVELFKNGVINQQDFDYYLKYYEKNEQSKINTLKINNQNKCTKCNKNYSVKANGPNCCEADDKSHEPTYQF